MKKNLSILSFSLVACGNEKTDDKEDNKPQEMITTEHEKTEEEIREELKEELKQEIKEELKQEEEQKQEENKEENKEEQSEVKEDVVNDIRGYVVDGMFVNEYFNIRFDVKNDYTVLSDKQLMNYVGIATDSMVENDYFTSEQMKLAMNGSIYDTCVVFEDDSSNILICYEDMDITNFGNYISAEDYLNVVIGNIKKMDEGLAYTNLLEAKAWGDDYVVGALYRSTGQAQIYLVKIQDNYAISLIITASSEENLDKCTNFVDSFDGFEWKNDEGFEWFGNVEGEIEENHNGWTFTEYTAYNDNFAIALPYGYSYSQDFGQNVVIAKEEGNSIISFYFESGAFRGMQEAYYDVYIETILQTYPGLEFKDVKLGQYDVKLGEGVYNGRNVAVAISVGDNYLIYAEAGSNNEASLKEFFNGITVK